jgi:hypothetical protein
VIDVAPYLRVGGNTIVVKVLHYGISTFHQIPQEAGLLAQLEVATSDCGKEIVCSDSSWRMTREDGWRTDTARISIQMEHSEWYNAASGLSGVQAEDYDDSTWPFAREWHHADAGPWQNLKPRDVHFLTREPLYPERVVQSAAVKNAAHSVTFNLKKLCYPDDLSANILRFVGAISTVINTPIAQDIPVHFSSWGSELYCHGVKVEDNTLHLQPGENLLTIIISTFAHLYEYSIGFYTWHDVTLQHPSKKNVDNPWGWSGPFFPMEDTSNKCVSTNDTVMQEANEKLVPIKSAVTAAELMARCDIAVVPVKVILLADAYTPFRTRQVQRIFEIPNATGMLSDNSERTVISPVADGDIEICLDLGRETVGWVEFELESVAGTVIDCHLVEYMVNNRPQHSDGNRNGFRYITQSGTNHFVSLKRRGGRYIFLTLRNMTAPVKIRTIRMLQATYPAQKHGQFLCSDAAMNRIWDISVRTLQLCMEDTFTDCPLYEQTLWVGDARNEALYAQICFGASDINLRCLWLTAYSLEDLPLVICQTPSGWDIMLTAWCMMWGINVWEYYFATGDMDSLRDLYPYVIKNIQGAQKYCEKDGLLSIHAWNMFDWAGIDQGPDTVIHNSLFLVGAIDAAIKCSDTLKTDDGKWLRKFMADTLAAVLPLWNETKQSYPDSIHDDGEISKSTSQHTSALALLYDVLPNDTTHTAALRNILTPPEDMVKVGSPFALQFFMEALEKSGEAASAVAIIRDKWQDMLDCGATTCWETFRGWEHAENPTRSHCHAWSAGPIYVFSRSVLGVVPTAVGGAEVIISPHPVDDLTWAKGTVWTANGNITVSWKLKGDIIDIHVDAPDAINWRVERNEDWKEIAQAVVNGKVIEE